MQRFLFTNCTLFHNELFVLGVLGGLPAKINLYSGKIEYYDDIKGLIAEKKSVIIDFMENFQDKIYALSSDGFNLMILDMKEYQCHYIPLNCNYQTEMNFVAFERYQSDYYIFSKYGNRIFVFNIEKNTVTEIPGCLDDTDEIQCTCRVENSVWILPKESNIIYCYDLSKRIKERCELKGIIRNCIHAVFKNGCIYILNRFGIIYIWNIKKRELTEITVLEKKNNERLSMSKIIYAGNKLILLPAYDKDIKILDLSTRRIELYHNYPNDFYDWTVWLKFYGYCEDEEYYYFAMCAGNYLLRIEKKSGKLIWTRVDPLGEAAMQFYSAKCSIVFSESQICKPTDLIKVLPKSKNQYRKMDIGKSIYGIIKK